MSLAQLWPSWLEALLSSQKSRVWPAKCAPGPPGMAGTSPTACFGSPGNHSCIPNAETSFPDNNFLLHLTALEDIEAGEVRQGHAGKPGGSLPSPQTPNPSPVPLICPAMGRFPGWGEFQPYPTELPLDPAFPRGFWGGSQPGPFSFCWQEICISYLDCCQRERSRHSRNKILR